MKALLSATSSAVWRRLKHGESSLAGGLQPRNILVNSTVHQRKVNAQVIMHQDVSEPSQPLPIDRKLRGPHSFAESLARFRQSLQVPENTILNQMRGKEVFKAAGRVLLDACDAAQDVLQVDSVVFHRATASSSTRRRSNSSRPRSVTICTRRPKSSSNSDTSPPGNQGLGLDPTSTSRSTSLAGPASPRAMEPNTRTLLTPCLRASRRISSRFAPTTFFIQVLPSSTSVLHRRADSGGDRPPRRRYLAAS